MCVSTCVHVSVCGMRVCMCTCVHMSVCVYACACMCTCMHVCTHVCMCVRAHLCACECVCTRAYECAGMCAWECMCACMYVCAPMRVCVCICVHMCVHASMGIVRMHVCAHMYVLLRCYWWHLPGSALHQTAWEGAGAGWKQTRWGDQLRRGLGTRAPGTCALVSKPTSLGSAPHWSWEP